MSLKLKIKAKGAAAVDLLGKNNIRDPHVAQKDLASLNGDGSRGGEMMDENPDSRQAEGKSKSENSGITKVVRKTLSVPTPEATPVQGFETVDAVDRDLPADYPERARRANNQARDMRTNLGRGKSGYVEAA
jgi:hypothetical protein